MFITNPNNQLATFEDAMNAYKKFPEGGFWIRKVIQHLGVFQEAVLGPYKYNDAMDLAKRWKSLFKFEGKEVAKVLSFRELICSGKGEIEEIDEKWKWTPPLGSKLLCLVHGYYPFVTYMKDDTRKKEFRKFYDYAETEGILGFDAKFDFRLSGIHAAHREMSIFFDPSNSNSYRRAYVASKFLNNLKRADRDYIKWCLDTIQGTTPTVPKPLSVPGYVENIDKECYPINIDFFKEQYEKSGNVLRNTFNKLWKCASEDHKKIVYLPEDEHKQPSSVKRAEVLHLDIIFEGLAMRSLHKIGDNGGGGIRKMYFERIGEKYNIILTDYDDSFTIGVYDINSKNGSGEMIIHLPPDELDPPDLENEVAFISRTLQDGRFFTKVDIIGAVLLFICKSLHMKHIWVADEQESPCSCGENNVSLFINPVRYLAGYNSIYASLGFVNKNEDEMRAIVEPYREKDLPIVVDTSLSEFNDNGSGDEEVVNYMNIESLAKLYLDKSCTYENACQILSIVTEEIREKISTKYHLDLDEIELSYYKNFF